MHDPNIHWSLPADEPDCQYLGMNEILTHWTCAACDTAAAAFTFGVCISIQSSCKRWKQLRKVAIYDVQVSTAAVNNMGSASMTTICAQLL